MLLQLWIDMKIDTSFSLLSLDRMKTNLVFENCLWEVNNSFNIGVIYLEKKPVYSVSYLLFM